MAILPSILSPWPLPPPSTEPWTRLPFNMTGSGLRLISFDGGGARSLSELKIMHSTITRLQYDLYPNGPDKVVLPYECFDLMGGSDTGAVIAIMLSKLQMSIEDAAEEFHRICIEVYVDGLSAVERTGRLQKTIEELLTRRGFPVDLKLGRDARVAEDRCPCFVIAIPTANIEAKVKLRSYRIRTEQASNITVVEAILATCATHPNFLPISIGPVINRKELVGGDMGGGNPTRELVLEAYNLFGKEAHVSTILSLGSGRLGALAVPSMGSRDEWMVVLRDRMKDCEQAAQEMETQLGRLGIYHRFSVEQGLQRIYGAGPNDVGWLNTQVDSYLEDAQVSRKLDHCVESLRLRQGRVTLEQLKHSSGGQPIYKGMPPLTSHFVMQKESWEKMTSELISGDGEQEKKKGRQSDAEPLQQHVLNIREERLDDTHAETLLVMQNIASTYHSQGRPSDAESLQQHVLKIRKEKLGDTHVDTLRSMHNLASTYHSQGRHSDAEPLQRYVLDRRKEMLGDTHADTLSAMNNLASSYDAQGRHSDAELLQRHVLKIRKEILGDTHADTLLAMYNLALTYHSQGRYSDAEPLHQHLFRIKKEQLGDTHAETLLAMQNLASTYYWQKRYSDARPLQENVLEGRRKLHGAHHLDIALSMNNLAWTYYCLGMFTEAKELTAQAKRVRRDILGVDHPDYKNTARLLQYIDEALVPKTPAPPNPSLNPSVPPIPSLNPPVPPIPLLKRIFKRWL